MTDTGPSQQHPGALRLLIVCTANQCRSPMGEVLARDLAERAALPLVARSAGTETTAGRPATDGARMTMRRRGLDLSPHASRRVTDELVAEADLVVAMERRHVVDLVTSYGSAVDRTFTLPELAARAGAVPSRAAHETVSAWLERVGEGRTPLHALSALEIEDPIGRSLRRYRATASLIEQHLEQLLTAAARPRQ